MADAYLENLVCDDFGPSVTVVAVVVSSVMRGV